MKGRPLLRCEQIPDLASDFMDGGLTLWQRLQVRLHLAICGACTAYVAQLRKTVALLRSLAPPAVAPGEETQVLAALSQAGPPLS